MSAGLLRLLLPALLVVGGAAAGLAQTMPNRAAEYAAAARPWLRCGIEQAARPGNGRFEIGRIWRVPPRKEPR